MVSFGFQVIGAEKLIKTLGDKSTIQDPLKKSIKQVVELTQGLAAEATVVGTPESTGIAGYSGGGLRGAVVSHKAVHYEDEGLTGIIGPIEVFSNYSLTNYAPFVEFGTRKMEARHMEGGTKVLGKGMFTYALERLAEKIKEQGIILAKAIQARFG